MSNYVLLGTNAHKDLKVITARSKNYGDNVMHAMTFPMEFRDVQSSYPIFFCKDPESGQFYPTALFGLEQDQNLFLTEDGWDAAYIPMMIRRHPFLIGYQADSEHEDGKRPVVSIDMDNPRISESEGEPLFTESDEPTDYLKASISVLESIHGATGVVKQRMEAMSDMGDAMKAMASMVKGKQAFEPALFIQSGETIAEHSDMMPKLFPAGSMVGKSEALPTIWQQWDDFVSLGYRTKTDAEKLVKMARDGTELRPLTKQFVKLASDCKACHKDYRKKK